MQRIPIQIRPGDCDGFAHVNNAVYFNYIQYAFAEALSQVGYAQDWLPESEFFWGLRDFRIEYRQAVSFGDRLNARVYLLENDAQSPLFGCELFRQRLDPDSPEEICIRSQAVWKRFDRKSGNAVPLPESISEQFPQGGRKLSQLFKQPEEDPRLRLYSLQHTIIRAEIGPNGHIRPQALYNWLEEAVFAASAEAGWTPERRREIGVLIFQMRHDSEFLSFPKFGETIEIVSRLAEVRSFRGTWFQEIFLVPQKKLLARDYSTGVFVNLEGRPTAPPPGTMDNIQFS
jgi:acyl-CoA thioester hydrolase